MTLTEVLLDFAMVSFLLIVSSYLRRKIKILQHFYIPAALIAGALGILLGPQVLGKISPIYLKYSDSIGQWAGVLTAIVFSASFLGVRLEKVSSSALRTYFAAGTVHQLQVVVGIAVTFVLGYLFKDLKLGFGLLPVLGFYGGHSMSIAGGTIYEEAGYMQGGAAVGATFGTIGMLVGVIMGMVIINYAAQRGITKVKMKREELPKSMLTGYIEPVDRKAIAHGVTASSTLDPFASQLMLVGCIILLGHVLRTALISVNPFWKNLPLFACSLIMSAIFTLLTRNSQKVNDMIDRLTITRISGTALDYMITAAIGTTSLKVFVDYGIPLIIVSIFITIVTYIGCFVIGKYILQNDDYFETAIGLFGQTCGVLATGLMLLKVVDPDYETNAATNITSSSTLGYTYQLQYTLLFVPLIMSKPMLVFGWSLFLLVLLFGGGLIYANKSNKKGVSQVLSKTM